jgi:Cys-rich protein (TIGR01571 family)
MMKRQKLREKYKLKESPCGDCPTTFFCGPCALCQEARELKSRGKFTIIIYIK